jgi:hypothetical protein
MLGLIDGSTASSGLWFGTTSAATNLSLFTFDGTTQTQLATVSNVVPSGALVRIDMNVVNFGASSTITIYVNGTLSLTFSGNCTVTGVTNVNAVGVLGNSAALVSEIVVADEDTRGWPGLVTMAPNGNGTTQNWSNPAFTNYNPITINDANATFTNTAAQDEQATLIDLPAGTFTIKACKIAARALHTAGSTATGVKLGVNNGGSVGVGTTQTLGTAFANVEQLFATDPTTSAAWAFANMNGMQLDLQSV